MRGKRTQKRRQSKTRKKPKRRSPRFAWIRFGLYAVQSGRCFYCLSPVTFVDVTLDHLVPICKGGKSDLSNLVASCEVCNSLKGSSEVHPDWVRERIEAFNFRNWNVEM